MGVKTDKKPVDQAINNFMSVTSKNTVAVIIPMYGYWSDIKDNPLIKEKVFSFVMDKLQPKKGLSSIHYLSFIVVANPQTLPTDMEDPESVANVILSLDQGGNLETVPVNRDATYAEYIEAGMEFAINETKAQFMIVFNPWVLVQDNAIDVLVDRANRSDDAKVISGFDFRSLVEIEQFSNAKINIPTEEWDLSFDFLAMPRFMAELVTIDTGYKTHAFLQRDLWQQVFTKGFGVITSQRVPIFPLDFPWKTYESKEDRDLDKSYFGKKWGFVPQF